MRVEYVAFDGTKFDRREECESYETTTIKEIKKKFVETCVKSVHEGMDLTNEGSAFVEASCGEDDYYVVVRLNNEEELKIAQAYQKLVGTSYGEEDKRERKFERTDIGKDLIVYVGNCDYGKSHSINWSYCCIHGTLDEVIDEYRNAMLKMFQPTNEKDANRIKF